MFICQVSELHSLIDVVTASYDKFFFGDVGRDIYNFFWGDFADWYSLLSMLSDVSNKKLIYVLKPKLIAT